MFPANLYLFKVNIRNTRESYEICSELKIHQNGVVVKRLLNNYCSVRTYFTPFLVFLLLALNKLMLAGPKIWKEL